MTQPTGVGSIACGDYRTVERQTVSQVCRKVNSLLYKLPLSFVEGERKGGHFFTTVELPPPRPVVTIQQKLEAADAQAKRKREQQRQYLMKAYRKHDPVLRHFPPDYSVEQSNEPWNLRELSSISTTATMVDPRPV